MAKFLVGFCMGIIATVISTIVVTLIESQDDLVSYKPSDDYEGFKFV